MTLTVGSLFSGIGGLDLGLERAGMRVVWQSEVDPYASRVLAKHWPDVPNLGDVTRIDWSEVERPDLICGGFPCQDISSAHVIGTRKALEGDRSGLWDEFAYAVEALRPRWVLVENVDDWHRWLSGVRSDLAAVGYASLPVQLSAGEVGAPHERPRVFVVAHADGDSEPLGAIHASVAALRPVPRGYGAWAVESDGIRVDDGFPHRMDRLRVLGNAVVPDVDHVANVITCGQAEPHYVADPYRNGFPLVFWSEEDADLYVAGHRGAERIPLHRIDPELVAADRLTLRGSHSEECDLGVDCSCGVLL